jgi:hypothetical protein
MNTTYTRNMQRAFKILAAIPADRFVRNLDSFYENDFFTLDESPPPFTKEIIQHHCDTLGCAAGWLATDKHFKNDRILRAYLGYATNGSSLDLWHDWAVEHFGINSFRLLFDGAGGSPYDHELLSGEERDDDDEYAAFLKMPAKLIALYRMRRHLGDEPDEANLRARMAV